MSLKNFCPICAAVVVTWVIMLALLRLGFNIDATLLGILMGMSVGAIATKYGQNILWKTAVVALGSLMAWLLITGRTFLSLIPLILIILLSLPYKTKAQETDRFKDCC